MIVTTQFLAVFSTGKSLDFTNTFDTFDSKTLSLYIFTFKYTYVIFKLKKINIMQITCQMCQKPHKQGGAFDR